MSRKVVTLLGTLSLAALLATAGLFVSRANLAKGQPGETVQGVSPAGWASVTLSSAFAVQNRGSSTATIVVDYYNENGTSAGSQSQVVGPKSIGNFAAPMTGPWKGSAVVSSDQPIVAIANDADSWSGATSYGTYNGFASSDVATTMYLPFAVRERPVGRNSLIGVQNAGSSTADVTISYYAIGSGTPKKNVTVNIPVGAANVRNLFSDDADLQDMFMGYVKIVSNNSVPVAAAAIDVANQSQYSYSGIAAPSTSLYMPFIQKNRNGMYPNGENTAWALLNTSSSNATINVTYTGSTPSGPATVNQSVVLGPYQMWNLAHADVPGLPNGFLGSAVATSSQPIVGIVNATKYSEWATPGKKTSYRAVSGGTQNLALPALWRNWSNKQTGVIIQNLDNVPTTLTATFTPRAGSGNPATITQVVGPNGFWNFGLAWGAGAPNNFDALGPGFYGAAEITSSTGRIVGIVNVWSDGISGDSMGTYNAFNY